MSGEGPLLVFGPRSTTYDFGPHHPLTPRRFGPGIDLLRHVGAEPGLAPGPAADDELLTIHTADYIACVRRFSGDPDSWPERGIGLGDNPPFAGMHEAAASVAGGSLRAMEAILRGDVEHAFHPGGGLHHAMAGRASGFCVYDDPALAIALARRAGHRVLYIDLDVHHGDGVQALHAADPGVLTFSIHESGMTLFPGTGFVGELGLGDAIGTAVNVPLEAGTGEGAWLDIVQTLLPELASAFGPDVIVSQHGADSHAWDPLANLRMTTTAMAAAARLVDRLAHRWARGRWLSTGGGGYDVYRVVPRAWAATWLAGAHRELPDETPADWRERWAGEAEAHGQAPLPERFEDAPNAGVPYTPGQDGAETESRATAEIVRRIVVPPLLREGTKRGWWSPLEGPIGEATGSRSDAVPIRYRPAILDGVGRGTWDRLELAPRVVAPTDPTGTHALVGAAMTTDGVKVTAAVDDTRVVGLVVSASSTTQPGRRDLLAVGVAPAARRQGLATRMLAEHVGNLRPGDETVVAELTVAERDPVEPLSADVRLAVARRLLAGAGFVESRPDPAIADADPTHAVFRHGDLPGEG
jgi:acetoin utilization protein AcuC